MNSLSKIQYTQSQSLHLIQTSFPVILVVLRFILGPVLLWDALDGQTGTWFIIGYVVAFLSDILDGVIARHLGVSTAQLRKADSWADVCLYVCIAASAWLVHADVIVTFSQPLSWVVGVQLIWWVVNLVKYGQPASYHTYSAKAWGVTLFIAAIALFGFNYGGLTLGLAIVAGIIHTVEEIAMTLILPTWTHDVLSIFHAMRLR